MPRKRAYRSKGTYFILVVVPVLGLFTIPAIVEADWTGRVIGSAITLFLMVLCIRFGFSGVIVEGDGVRVRNPLRTRYFPWAEIRRFSMRTIPLLGENGQVEMNDGRRILLWGIAPPNRATFPYSRTAEQMLDELNSQLDEHARLGPASD